jgi:hypothetical protein
MEQKHGHKLKKVLVFQTASFLFQLLAFLLKQG